MLIIFAMLVVPITFTIGAVAVDASMWQSERRGAHKDADLSALAGAFELLREDATVDEAQSAAQTNADANDEADNASVIGEIQVDASCFGGGTRLDSVIVNIDHDSRPFFSEFFGIDAAPDIGAHARACAGSIIEATGLRPFAIESEQACDNSGSCVPPADDDCFEFDATLGMRVPRFGEWCQLDDGSADASTSERGLIDLNQSGLTCSDEQGNDVRDNTTDGSGATCRIGDVIYEQPGAQPGNDIRGIRDLLAGNGTPAVADGAQCDDSDAGTIDDFDEVLERIDGGTTPSPDAVFQLRDCVSPRVVHLVVIDNFDATPPRIVGFAAFYILGCKLTNQQLSVLPNKCATGSPGQLQLWGIFFNKVELSGNVGEFNPFGTHKIALVE
jgi:hypothetical protein